MSSSVDSVVRDGWLNRQVVNSSLFSRDTGPSWRLVRAQLRGGTLSIYSVPSLHVKYFDVNAPSEALSANASVASLHSDQQSFNNTISQATKNDGSAGIAPPGLAMLSSEALSSTDSLTLPKIQAPLLSSRGPRSSGTSSISVLTATQIGSPLDSSFQHAMQGQLGSGPIQTTPTPGRPHTPSSSSTFWRSSSPHPQLVFEDNEAESGPPTALAHHVLFANLSDQQIDKICRAMPFSSDILAVLHAMRQYIDSATAGQMGVDPKLAAERAAQAIRSVLRAYISLILNDHVHGSLQQLADAITHIDDTLATALKRDIYKCHRDASVLATPSCARSGAGPKILPEKVWPTFHHQVRESHSHLWLLPELFLDTDFSAKFAVQISAYHHHFLSNWSPVDDYSLLFHRPGDSSFSCWRQNPLVFDLDNPHFLGTMVMNHALSPQLSSSQRGMLLQQWVLLGVQLRKLGDIVGWNAIAAVICLPPILRLREAWSFVEPQLRYLVSNDWGFEVFELEKRAAIDLLSKTTFRASTEDMGVKYSKEQCIPYFGDIIITPASYTNHGLPSLSHVEEQLQRISAVIDGWTTYCDNVPLIPSTDMEPLDPFFADLFTNWCKLNVTQSYSLSTALPNSLIVEPRVQGSYLQYHYTQQPSISDCVYLPILFTEPLPSFRLLPKEVLLSTSNAAISTFHQYGPRRSLRGLASLASSNNGDQHHQQQQQQRSNAVGDAAHPPLQRSNSFPPSVQVLTTGLKEVELGTREYVMNKPSHHRIATTIRDLFNVHVTSYTVGDDIVLKTSVDESAHSSRTSSIIETSTWRSTTEKKRDSLQNLEPVSRTPFSELQFGQPSVKVVVKAATLGRLVDIMVLGVNEFRNGGSNPQNFRMDLSAHIETFMATFRSFCSPAELLRMLEFRFHGACSAAESIAQNKDDSLPTSSDFPKWGQPVSDQSKISTRILTKIYTNLFEALQLWITRYYSDFADDADLKDMMQLFLSDVEATVNQGTLPDGIAQQAKRLVGSYAKQRFKVSNIMDASSLPPPAKLLSHVPLNHGVATLENALRFIEDVDILIAERFRKITHQDWLSVFELLETQTSDPHGLMCYIPSPQGGEEDIHVQNIYTYLLTLYRSSSDTRVFTKFPLRMAELFRLHSNISAYVTHEITDPSLYPNKQGRVATMSFFLKTLGLLRTSMQSCDLFPNAADNKSRIPSFMETAIVEGILRPESRQFSHSWLQSGREVAMEFPNRAGHVNVDNLTSTPNSKTIFVPEISIADLGPLSHQIKPVTPCIGWVIERFFEIVCYVPNMSIEHPELINFDKRRFAFNLIKNIQADFILDSEPHTSLMELQTRYDYILNPDALLYQLDRKMVREALNKEHHKLPKSQLKQRVFTATISAEIEKRKIDAKQQELFTFRGIPTSSSASNLSSRERRSMKHRPASILSTSLPLSAGISSSLDSRSEKSSERDRNSNANSLSTSGRSKSRFGSNLLKAVRPISMAFSSSGSSPQISHQHSAGQGHSNSAHPLDLPAYSLFEEQDMRQVMVLDLGDYDIKGPRQGFSFKLVKDGSSQNEHVFQATDAASASSWVSALAQARKESLARTQLLPGSKRVFGIPLEIVCAREQSQYPRMIETLLGIIESQGLSELGLYRVSGSLTAVNALKLAFDEGEQVLADDPRCMDIHVLAGCVKLYLRELPESLLTRELFRSFMNCAANPMTDEHLDVLRSCIDKLPDCNRHLLDRLMTHLGLVVQNEARNKMTTPNLAIVFSMNFLPPDGMDQMKPMQNIISAMILHRDVLFGFRHL